MFILFMFVCEKQTFKHGWIFFFSLMGRGKRKEY